MSLVNNFNGKNVQYFIVDGTKISDEEKIEEILNNENTRIQLPRNCILFTEVKNNYQMYLIDDLGCSKRVEFPLDKVYKDIRSTVSYAYNNLMVNVTYAYNNAIEKVIKVAEDTELSIQILAYNFSYELLNHIEQINRNKENIAANATGISINTENILYLSQLINNKADKTELDNYYTKTKSHEIFAEINHTHDEYLTQHQSLEDYATKSYISNNYQIKDNYVKMVTVNGTGIEPDVNGNVDLGELQTQLGLTGIQGIQGATGIAGTNGKQGVTGVAGKQGITGINGLQGATGINGKQGATGINGIKGATGAKGLTPNIGIGSCITVNSDVQASVWITTGPNANDINLNFNIPKGERGAPGSSGSGNTTIVSNEWEDIQGKPSWHSVAFSGNYNELNGLPTIPSLEGYATIAQLTNALSSKISSDNINKINKDEVNNEKVLKIFWGEDNGYNFTLYPNVQANWNQTDASKPDFIIGKPDSAKFTNVWMKGAKLISTGFEYYNKDSIQRVVYSLKNNGEEDYESKVNKRDGTPMFIQNDVSGYHSVGMGWANIINGDHSVSEGKLVTVNGDFSHGMGYYTNINGNYSFAGGLDDGNIFTHDYPTNNYVINGNYSFGIGKNIRTYNHGEIAFGKYNESKRINKNTNQDIEKISLPRFNEIVYDSLGNPWKIIDFYNIDTVDNFDPDNVDQFVQIRMSADGYQSNYNGKPLYYCYNYGYNPTDIHLKIDGQQYTFKVNKYYGINTEDGPDFNTGGNAVDDRDDKYLYYIFKPDHPEISYDIELVEDDESYENSYYEHSNNFSEFIYKIFDKKCNYIINNYVKSDTEDNDFYNINDFCECILYNINYYRTNYEYIYNIPYNEGSPQGIGYTTDPIIIGVIAQKLDQNNQVINDEYEFFIWGPNSLYYNNELFTMFSIGNGNQYKRNNLFEITNDGNVYYDNGKKDLFSLNDKINDIEENLDININITNYDNTYISNNDIIINTYQNNNDFITSLYECSYGGQSTIIPINHNSPKQLFINDEQYLQIDKSYLSTVKDYDVQNSWRYNTNSGLYKYENDDYAYYYTIDTTHYLVKIINKDIHFYINETENYSFRKNIIIENKFDFGTAIDNPYFDVSGSSSDYPYFVFHADNNIKIYFEYNLYEKYSGNIDTGIINENTKYLRLFDYYENINLINIEINVLNKICLVNVTIY